MQSESDNEEPVQTVKEPVHVEQQLTPPQVELNKYPFNFSAYIEATSKDEAIEKLREFKPKLIEFMEREGVHYGNNMQKPKFSVAITTPAYKKLINNTLKDPQRANNFIANV